MRRFIHAIAIAGVLVPALAAAQTPDAGTPPSGPGTTPAGTTEQPGTTAPAGTTEQPATTESTTTTTTSTEAPTTTVAPATTRRRNPEPSGSTQTPANNGARPNATTAPPAAGATTAPPAGPETTTQAIGRIMRGSTFTWDNSVSAETLFPGSQLSRDPSYQWWFSLRTRFQLHRNFSLRVRQDMTLEWFPTESTTRDRAPQWGDLWTDFALTGIPPLAGFRFSAAIRAQWPLLNYAARSTGTYFTLGAVLGVSRSFENTPIGKSFSLSLAFIGNHAFTQYTTRGTPSRGYECTGTDFAPSICTQVTGALNPAFRLISSFSIGYTPVSRLDIGISYILINDWLYGTPDTVIRDGMGGTTVVDRAADDNRMRQSSWLLASVDFEATPWVSFSFGYYVFRSVLNPDGRYGNPFWAPDGATRVFLTTTFALDEIFNAATGGGGPAPTNTGPQGRITMNRPGETRSRLNETVRRMRNEQIRNGTF